MRRMLKQPDQNRRGTAAVEAAFCLPVIITLIVGSIEASNAIYLKQTATIAAYEAVKIASGQEGTTAAAEAAANAVLNSRNISSATVSVSPSVDGDTEQGTLITVVVTIPLANNRVGITKFFTNEEMKATVFMTRT